MKLNTVQPGGQRVKDLDDRCRTSKDYPWLVLAWLTKDLEECLTAQEIETVRTILRKRDVTATLRLADTWGLQSIPHQSRNFARIRARYAVSSLLKKYLFPGEKATRRLNACVKFLQAEDNCRIFNTTGYKKITCPDKEWKVNVWTYARRYLRKVLGPSPPGFERMTKWSRHGPGANLDTKDQLTNTYFKYTNWPYSCTIDAYRYARFLIQSDRRWFSALLGDYRERFNIPMHMPIDMEVFWRVVIKIVVEGKVSFANKNAETERTVFGEPCLNLMLQLGADGEIRTRLKRFGIDLDSQKRNQRMAFFGSLHSGWEGWATLDLSAASDSIAIRLCELLLPKDWYDYLMAIRTPRGILEAKELGLCLGVDFEKISSMGNGYTFALESVLFAAMIHGVLTEISSPQNDQGEYQYMVYGDDLIVPNYSVPYLREILGDAGFQLNLDKSFFFGNVRESCGSDWFHGKPLRPVFLSETPTTVSGLLVDINRLGRLLSLRFGIEDSCTVRNMCKWIPPEFRHFVGPRSDEVFNAWLHLDKPNTRCFCEQAQCFKFERMYSFPQRFRGKKVSKFHLRKLSAALRQGDDEMSLRAPPWARKNKLSSGGNEGCFTVVRPEAYTVRGKWSHTSHWCATYAEVN